MNTTDTTLWDSDKYLETNEDMAAYLNACLEENDPELVIHTLGVIVRNKGIAQIAHETRLDRESLHKALSAEGNSEFALILKAAKALCLRLRSSATP
ncbi:addiction module antidote protein [Methylomagnum sp.]